MRLRYDFQFALHQAGASAFLLNLPFLPGQFQIVTANVYIQLHVNIRASQDRNLKS